MMKIQITVDEDSAKTAMVGGGTQNEISQVIFQIEMLKYKLVKMLDDDGLGEMFVAKENKRNDGN